MDPVPEPPVPKNVAAVTGPVLVGITLNWYLYGLLSVQYILYLMYARGDKMIIKAIVHFIFLLDTVQTIFTMEDAFFWFAYNFGDISKIYQFHFSAIDVPTLDAIIALIVQMVYCWRIWVLSQWRVLPILTALLALLTGACGMATGIRDFQLGSVLILDESYRVPIMIWLFGSAVTDIIIASSMCYILLRIRREPTALRRTTGRKIMRLLTLTLETNAVTAAVAIETVVIFFFIKSIAPPATNIYEPGGYILGKLYSNCFMILLNQRHHHSTSIKTDTTIESGTMPVYNTSSSAPRGSTMTESMHEHQVSKPLTPSKSGLQRNDGMGGKKTIKNPAALPETEMKFSGPVQDTDTVNEQDRV